MASACLIAPGSAARGVARTPARGSAHLAAPLAPPAGLGASTCLSSSRFQGKSLSTARRSQAAGPVARRSTKVQAKQKSIQVEIDKPLGLKLKQSKAPGGGLTVTAVNGNGAKSGIKAGDTVIFTSSFFGDELWPADKLAFVNTTLQRAPSPVCVIYTQGDNVDYDVKKMPNKPAPKRFGRGLTAAQKERATHICIDCGYIYADTLPFNELSEDYTCPQCNAPPRRFSRFDVNTGKMLDKDAANLGTVATVIGGVVGIAVLAYVASTI
mmetsp:Transcript_22234/g.56967  ORF Transcript_22234/g.56967 Transcript_22234/m.56967 type:complete len:268 (-) Transcript_22234:125-928(-)